MKVRSTLRRMALCVCPLVSSIPNLNTLYRDAC